MDLRPVAQMFLLIAAHRYRWVGHLDGHDMYKGKWCLNDVCMYNCSGGPGTAKLVCDHTKGDRQRWSRVWPEHGHDEEWPPFIFPRTGWSAHSYKGP